MERSKGLGRFTAVAVAMGGLVIGSAGMSHAAGLPGPVPAPLTAVLAPVTAVASPVLSPSTGPSLPAPVGGLAALLTPSAAGKPAGNPVSNLVSNLVSKPATAPAPSSGGAPATAHSGAAPSSNGSGATSSPGSVRATTPVASLCLIPTGASSPAVDLGLTALGQDLSSPLVQHFPQVFAPCPAGVAPAPGQVAGVDVSVTKLLGLCVRVTRQVAPIQTTLVVLDQNLIQQLTAAGVPLQQLVVPCPAGSGSTGPGSTGSAGSTSANGAGTLASSALAGEALGDSTGAGNLAFTGMDLVPAIALAGVLVWLGALLLRVSRRVVPLRVRS